jgi:hypothetical protein
LPEFERELAGILPAEEPGQHGGKHFDVTTCFHVSACRIHLARYLIYRGERK